MSNSFIKKPTGLIASMFIAILFMFGFNSAYAKTYEVAYLSASSANTWLGASVREMEAVAGANNINITEFDAQFDPAKQTSQLQDAIASGKYDGIVINTLIMNSNELIVYKSYNDKKISNNVSRLFISRDVMPDNKANFTASIEFEPEQSHDVKFRASIIEQHKEVESVQLFAKFSA